MKTALATTAALALLITPAASLSLQAQTSGVSAPPAAVDPGPEAPVIPKPSAAVPMQPSYQSYQPYQPAQPSAPNASMPAAAPITRSPGQHFDPDAEVVTSVARPEDVNEGVVTSVPATHARYAATAGDGDVNEGVVTSVAAPEDVNAGVVTFLASDPNLVPVGTLLRARIRETLSTATTPVGSPFTAELIAPLEHDGRVIIPAGSLIRGRVTVVRGGKRISGVAAIHLLPERVILPDGTHYDLRAQVVDTDQDQVTRIDREGTLLRRDHIKSTLAVMSLTTGSAAAAGAVLGGGVGAVVGAGIGAGASTIWWLKQDRQLEVPEHTSLVFDLTEPLPLAPAMAANR
jgi:hypothetical protein